MIYEQRNHNGERVSTIRITLDTPPELIEQYTQDGYTEVMEHYLVLYKPPEKIVLQEKLDSIAAALPDEIAAEYPEIYPELKRDGSAVEADTRFNWQGKVVKAKVTLWDREDQDPDHAPNLWDILTFGGSGYREIPDTITTELAFAEGEIGYWPPDGKHYRAVRNGVVHTPATYPDDWEEVEV